MDFNLIIGSLQLILAGFQLKLDHFKTVKRADENRFNDFYALGEAIRSLESALAETISFIALTNERDPNERLAMLWEEASRNVRRVRDAADLADLTFEKNLYWRNPEFYRNLGDSSLQRISLDNVLLQLRTLRTNYDKVQGQLLRLR